VAKPVLHDRGGHHRDAELARWREWAARYDNGQPIRSGGRTGADLIRALEALPSDAPFADVEAATGETYQSTCDACGRRVDRVVTVGQEFDYDSATATLCRTCVVEALVLWSGALATTLVLWLWRRDILERAASLGRRE
jgi:hypothetical protein